MIYIARFCHTSKNVRLVCFSVADRILDVPLGLVKGGMNGDRREVAFPQQSVQLLCTADRLDEDADLVGRTITVSTLAG